MFDYYADPSPHWWWVAFVIEATGGYPWGVAGLAVILGVMAWKW